MIVNGIDTKDISVVVQGAVDIVNTPQCIKSIRKCFPGSELILSTWKGTNTVGLDYDILLLNDDPGGWKDEKTGFVNNLNRQLVSTKNGIAAATKKYCIKVRSDIVFKSNNFLKYYDKFPEYDPEYRLFENRILFCSFFFKRYLGEARYDIHPVPFHISDWFAFGLRKDVFLLFNVPLAREPYNTNYLNNHTLVTARHLIFGASHQYAPEQYILLECLRKNMEAVPQMNNVLDYNSESIEYSDRIAANNFIVLNPKQIQVSCLKNGIDPYRKWSERQLSMPICVWEGLYRYDVFVSGYKKYCDADYRIPHRTIMEKQLYLAFHRLFEVRKLR